MLRACQKRRGILPCEVQFARFSSFLCLLPCTKWGVRRKEKKKKRALCSAHPLSWAAWGLLSFVPPLHSSGLQFSWPWSFSLASLSCHSSLGAGKLEAQGRESPKLGQLGSGVTPGAGGSRTKGGSLLRTSSTGASTGAVGNSKGSANSE